MKHKSAENLFLGKGTKVKCWYWNLTITHIFHISFS